MAPETRLVWIVRGVGRCRAVSLHAGVTIKNCVFSFHGARRCHSTGQFKVGACAQGHISSAVKVYRIMLERFDLLDKVTLLGAGSHLNCCQRCNIKWACTVNLAHILPRAYTSIWKLLTRRSTQITSPTIRIVIIIINNSIDSNQFTHRQMV